MAEQSLMQCHGCGYKIYFSLSFHIQAVSCTEIVEAGSTLLPYLPIHSFYRRINMPNILSKVKALLGMLTLNMGNFALALYT